MATQTVDAVQKLEVLPSAHFNEIRTLATLSSGLRRLYAMLKSRELEFERRCGEHKVVISSFGIDFDGTRSQLDTIACFFHWFGVSVCNYARLVGFIHGIEKKHFTRADLGNRGNFPSIKKAVGDYVDSVTELADVQIWRNKVGAHFAITDPHKDDNVATLDMSAIFPVAFEGRYVVGGTTMTRSGSSGSHTSQLPCWSLTAVFESLIPRFWPTFRIPTVEQSRQTVEAHAGDGGNI